MSNEIENEEKQREDALYQKISILAEKMKGIYDDAVLVYTPIVNDICNRKATEKDVCLILTWLLDYAGEERMLELFKKVCRSFLLLYPDTIAWYIMEYRKLYDPESLKGTKWECLLEESDIDDE